MRYETKSPNNRLVFIMLSLAIAWLCSILLAGCGTVTPDQVVSDGPSWDGTNRNSGFVGWTSTGCGILTPHARDRYNALVKDYGSRFRPPLQTDYGLVKIDVDGQPTVYQITPEALADFATMNRWRRMEGK